MTKLTALALRVTAAVLLAAISLGAQTDDLRGSAVAACSDLNGDGVPDRLVGAPGDDTAFLDAGRVDLVSGSDGAVITSWLGAAPDARMGRAVAAGDLDGDGASELVLAAPGYAPLQAGSVLVIDGATLTTLHSFTGPGGHRYGDVVRVVGDVDADGSRDFVIAATGVGFPNFAYAHVRSGASGATIGTLDHPAAHPSLYTVADAGDVDADGHDDVIVGFPGFGVTGRVVVTSGADGSMIHELFGLPYGSFGAAVTGLGDVDGDGTPDFAVGSPAGGFALDPRGWVDVFSGADASLVRHIPGEAIGEAFGFVVVGCGDLTGDGRPELAASAHQIHIGGPGVARVFSAHDGWRLVEYSGAAAADGLGSALDVTADVTGDGDPDLIAGAPFVAGGTGAVSVFELGATPGPCGTGTVVDPAGQPFDVLHVAGSGGGPLRRVIVPVGQPFTVRMLQPPLNPNPALWALWGIAGIPDAATAFPSPFGTFCFTPHPLAPGDASLFTVANAYGPDPGALLPASSTPALLAVAGIPFPLRVTLQPLVTATPAMFNSLAIGNAVVVDVR